MKLQNRIFLFFAPFVLLVVVAIFILNYYAVQKHLIRNAESEITEKHAEIMNGARTMLNVAIKNYLRGITEKNLDIIRFYYNEYSKGIYTEEQAKDLIQEYLLKQKVGENGYFVALLEKGNDKILDIHPVQRHVVCTHTEGCMIWAKHRNGFVQYDWINPGDSIYKKKVAYLKEFPEWNWIFGATSYRDDFLVLLNINDLRQYIQPIKVSKSGYFFIQDTSGNILVHPQLEGTLGTQLRDAAGDLLFEKLVKNQGTVITYGWKNPDDHTFRQKFAYMEKMDDYPYYIAASGYLSDINSPLKAIIPITILTTSIVLVALLVIILIFSKKLAKPLNYIGLGMQNYFDSDVLFKWNIASVSEISYLGKSLEELTSRLNAKRHMLEEKLSELDESNTRKNALAAFLQSLINSMPSVLIGIDADGKVIQWNTYAEKTTGITGDSAIGKLFTDVYPGLSELAAAIQESVRNGKVYTLPKYGRVGNDNSMKYDSVTVYPIDSSKKESGAVIIISDITERVRLEEVIIQNEKMLSVGGLAAGMAHEINNPLGGMMQTTSVIQSRLADETLPSNIQAAEESGLSLEALRTYLEKRKIFEMLERIQNSGQRAAKIVRNMLSFARKSSEQFIHTYLSELIDQCIELTTSDYNLKKNYDFKKVNIIREYEYNLPPVLCDYGKIQQVIINVLRNGAEAMAEIEDPEFNPEIRIRLKSYSGNKYQRVEIQDNGPGMDESVKKRVFEPFYTTKATNVGTGLGLSVSYFIITENHQGKMWVESEKGKGSRFVFLLPINPM